MAIVSQGDALTVPLQQPGGKFADDGYGLITATVVWKSDQSASLGSVVNRGSTCPLAGASFCDAHKYSITYDNLGVATIVVDYVGIDPTINSGTRTNPQVAGSQGLTTEHITSHPNFFELATGFTGDPIAGVGASPGTKTTPNYAQEGNEFTGNNGSTFERQTGGKFLGFKKPLYDTLYGKTNYLAPQTSFSGHFYTTDTTNVTGLRSRVGKTSGTNQFNGIKLIPDYIGTSFTVGTPTRNQMLLAQISFEDYGSLYKVTYEIRYNRDGYDKSVYADA